MALVSARITERTARNWTRTPRSARRLLDGFSLILAQDADSAARLESLGRVPDGRLNLKYAGDPLKLIKFEMGGLRIGGGAGEA